MRTDEELKAEVMERLDSIPVIKASDIGVSVYGGMVTLDGEVDTHQTRFQVERTIRRVPGIRGLQSRIMSTSGVSKRGIRS